MSKKKLSQYIIRFDHLLTIIETNLGILFFGCMIVIVLIGIFLRFVMRIPNVYGEELSMHCLFASTMVGISLGVRSKSHLGIEGFVNMIPGKLGKIVRGAVALAVMGMFAFMSYISFTLAETSRQFGSVTAALQLPFYVIYYAMFVIFGISLLQSIFLFINDYVLSEPILKIEGAGTLS